MANDLSRQEAVDVILGGGVRGSNGTIEGQEGYYSFDAWSMIPFMSDQWQGIALNSTGAYGSVINVYGSATEPYFMCRPGTEYTSQGEEIAGYSMTFEYGVWVDPSDPTVFTDQWVTHYYAFNKQGQVVAQSENRCDYEPTADGYIYLDLLAGYNDNHGEWTADYVIGLYRESDGAMRSFSAGSYPGGRPLIDAICTWGAGQTPVIDDGATPTGGSGGGGGYYSRPDETIGIPGLPSINLADLGLCSIYHVTPAQCANFSAYLWTPGGFIDTVLKNATAPMENIISLSMVPSMSFNEAGSEILIGNATSGVQAYKLLTTFYEIDCGTINVTEYYNNFADYQTKISIFLPFIGIRDISPNDCMSGYIKVVYHVDVFSGICVAFIQTQVKKGAWHVIASYNGQIATQVPLSGANYMGLYQSAFGAVSSAVSGNLMGGIGSLMNAKPEYQRSGSMGSTAGIMGIRYPYLIFSTPQVFTANGFKENYGYVSNLSGKISTFIDPQHGGFLQVDTSKLDLTNLVITDEERDMLYDLLDSGIYI